MSISHDARVSMQQLIIERDAAIAAISAENWTTAEAKLMAVKVLLATIPSGSAGRFMSQIAPNGIDSLLATISAKAKAARRPATLQMTDLHIRPEGPLGCRCG